MPPPPLVFMYPRMRSSIHARCLRSFSSPHRPPQVLVQGPVLLVFGGVTVKGDADDLWLFDPSLLVWRLLTPQFPGAAWPGARSYAATAMMIDVVDDNTLSTMAAWSQGIQDMMEHFMGDNFSYTDDMFPQPPNNLISAKLYQRSLMKTGLANAIAGAMQNYVKDNRIGFFCLIGGVSSTLGVLGDMWFFDLFTGLWHVPAGYSAYSIKGGVRQGNVVIVADTIIIQGGYDDVDFKSASPAIMRFDLGAMPAWNYPYLGWAAAYSSGFMGRFTDIIDGGLPPVHAVMKPSHMLSMGPVVFAAAQIAGQPSLYNPPTVPPARATWNYVDGSTFLAYVNTSVSPFVMYTGDNAWNTVSAVASNQAVVLGNYVAYLGGFGSREPHKIPTPTASAVNIRMAVNTITPVCTDILQILSHTYPFTLVPTQVTSSNASATCFLCSKGSYFRWNPSPQTSQSVASCVFCPRGSFSDAAGALQCKPCLPGFFSQQMGGQLPSSCLPCPIGFYQPNSGMSSCLTCPNDGSLTCPVGAQSAYKVSDYNPELSQKIQPLQLNEMYAESHYMINFILLIGVGVGILILALFGMGHVRPDLFPIDLTPFDCLFQDKHLVRSRRVTPTLLAEEAWKDYFLTRWQTKCGGLCSLLCLLCMGVFIATFSLPYLYMNLRETRYFFLFITLFLTFEVLARCRCSDRIDRKNHGSSDRLCHADISHILHVLCTHSPLGC
jgi:hypothetical protein